MLRTIMNTATQFHGATVLAAEPSCKGYLPGQTGEGVCRRVVGLVDSPERSS